MTDADLEDRCVDAILLSYLDQSFANEQVRSLHFTPWPSLHGRACLQIRMEIFNPTSFWDIHFHDMLDVPRMQEVL